MLPDVVGVGQPLRRPAQVLRAIEMYLRHYDWPPTVRDICRATGITSTSYVFYLLAGLELDGYITRKPGVSRSIRLTRPPGVPIVGSLAAGMPLDLFDAGAPARRGSRHPCLHGHIGGRLFHSRRGEMRRSRGGVAASTTQAA